MNIKKISAILPAIAMLLTAAACAGRGNEPASRDSVVIAIGSEPETLDPTQGWGHGNAPIVQSTLVRYTADLTFENDLATGYTLSDDGRTWTFTIRDDAYFTDGERVTASDAAFTLETAKAAQGSVDLTYMESAVEQDDTTLLVTLSRPTSIFLNTLASVGIVPEHAYGDDYGTNPIGSGPYKFVEWRADSVYGQRGLLWRRSRHPECDRGIHGRGRGAGSGPGRGGGRCVLYGDTGHDQGGRVSCGSDSLRR